MFDITKIGLKDLLKKVAQGDVQLPDFQRDYVWGDDDVRSLLASVAKGFPVGALLMLETGGEVNFKPRLLEGVRLSRSNENPIIPKELLLDGQQRITSLFQSGFCKEPVRTKNQRNEFISLYYYLDIAKAADSAIPLEEAIVGVPADKKIRSNFGRDIDLDLSTRAC